MASKKKAKCVFISLLLFLFISSHLIVLTNLLQLTHFALLACLADEAYAVDARLLAVAVCVGDEEHDGSDVLELDEAQFQLGCVCGGVPVFGLELDDLRGGDVVGFFEAEVVLAVCPDVDCFWADGGFVVVFGVVG